MGLSGLLFILFHILGIELREREGAEPLRQLETQHSRELFHTSLMLADSICY